MGFGEPSQLLDNVAARMPGNVNMSANPFFSILSASNQSQGNSNQNVSSNFQQQNNNMIFAVLNNELTKSYATIDRQHELLERQRTRDFLQQMMMMNNH